MTTTFTVTQSVQLTHEVCWCGMHHAIPSELAAEAKRHGTRVYCPLGHTWVVRRTMEADLEERTRELELARRRLQTEREAHDATKRSLSATRGALTKTQQRVAAGTCPACHRSFAVLARHMATKHPDYATAEVAR